MSKLFYLFVAFVCPSLLIAAPVSESFQKIVNQAAEDLNTAIKGTADTVGNVVEKNIAIAGFVGNTAVNAATVGSGAAVNYISSIDVEDAINKTEEAVINSKTALIKGAFDAKREALRMIAKAKEDHKDTVIGFINGTLDGFNLAMNTTASGIVLTKEVVANYTADVTMQNAQAALVNVINGTMTAVENAGSALTNALVNAKLSLHDAAENFNSQATLANATSNLASAVNVTVVTTANFVDQWGIFSAIDNLVQAVAAIPVKINTFFRPHAAVTTTPAVTTAAPAVTTVAPAVTTAAPAVTTVAPVTAAVVGPKDAREAKQDSEAAPEPL